MEPVYLTVIVCLDAHRSTDNRAVMQESEAANNALGNASGKFPKRRFPESAEQPDTLFKIRMSSRDQLDKNGDDTRALTVQRPPGDRGGTGGRARAE